MKVIGSRALIHTDKSYLKVIDISDAEDVVIATDGYIKLFRTLRDSEEHLQSLIKRDPIMIIESIKTKGMTKGNNSFDDRAYLKVKIVSTQ